MANIPTYRTGSPVYDQVLALLRSALWGEERFPYQAPQDVEWRDIIQELKNQTVQFLVVDLLARENPGKAGSYINSTAKSMVRWCNLLCLQQELCELLSDAAIPCAVVKGAAAAMLYPQPSGRLIGDIDLLVRPEDFEKACEIISRNAEFICETYRHREYKQNGFIVELHRSFSGPRDPQKRALFDQRVLRAMDAVETVYLDDYHFHCLPQAEHGLILLEHINIHLESGLGLRQILDWMMFADKVLDDRCWHTEFVPLLQELGLETLAVTVTRMCQMYLGLREDITWCAGADETLCQELMEHILGQGNFGRKLQRGANQAVSVISAAGNPWNFFRTLQFRGCKNWQAIDRYPFLKPFAWLYQIIRYIRLGLRTKHPLRFLRDTVKRAKSHEDFMEALGVYRILDHEQQR